MLKLFKTIFIFTCAIVLNTAVPALAADKSDDWEAQVRKTDDAYWHEFNFGTSAALNSYLAADVEFYHDLGGTVIGWDALAKVNAGMDGPGNRARRMVVPASLHIFPMRKGDDIYGAIVSGDHEFYTTDAGKIVKKTFQSSFTHLMLVKDGVWKIARIYSYNHQRPGNAEK